MGERREDDNDDLVFPIDVILKIIFNLDLKSLLRCKLLSKILKERLEFDSVQFNSGYLVKEDPAKGWSFTTDKQGKLTVIPNLEIYEENWYAVGSCCGVIMLADELATMIVLVNPLTNQTLELPSLAKVEGIQFGVVGIGYETTLHKQSKDLFVLRIDISRPSLTCGDDNCLPMIFRVSDGDWKALPPIRGLKFVDDSNGRYSAAVEGKLFWICQRVEDKSWEVLCFSKMKFFHYRCANTIQEIWNIKGQLIGVFYEDLLEGTPVDFLKLNEDDSRWIREIKFDAGFLPWDYRVENWFLSDGSLIARDKAADDNMPYIRYLLYGCGQSVAVEEIKLQSEALRIAVLVNHSHSLDCSLLKKPKRAVLVKDEAPTGEVVEETSRCIPLVRSNVSESHTLTLADKWEKKLNFDPETFKMIADDVENVEYQVDDMIWQVDELISKIDLLIGVTRFKALPEESISRRPEQKEATKSPLRNLLRSGSRPGRSKGKCVAVKSSSQQHKWCHADAIRSEFVGNVMTQQLMLFKDINFMSTIVSDLTKKVRPQADEEELELTREEEEEGEELELTRTVNRSERCNTDPAVLLRRNLELICKVARLHSKVKDLESLVKDLSSQTASTTGCGFPFGRNGK